MNFEISEFKVEDVPEFRRLIVQGIVNSDVNILVLFIHIDGITDEES